MCSFHIIIQIKTRFWTNTMNIVLAPLNSEKLSISQRCGKKCLMETLKLSTHVPEQWALTHWMSRGFIVSRNLISSRGISIINVWDDQAAGGGSILPHGMGTMAVPTTTWALQRYRLPAPSCLRLRPSVARTYRPLLLHLNRPFEAL